MKNKLKIYSPDIILSDVVEENLLYLGKVNNFIISKNKTFRDLISDDISQIIDYVDISDSDFIVYPKKINPFDNISELINLSYRYNKKILLFYNDDNDKIFNFENSILFRTSLYKSKKPENYFSLPAFCNDLKRECEYKFREKKPIPTVGFCGALTHNLRGEIVTILENKKRIIPNFKIRNYFWGGDIWGENVRKEYIENTLNSDFVLCVRGAGNFSYRFYETLCLGRIPLVIDTDIDLPFENYINYDTKILRIPIEDLDKIEDYIFAFWNNINDYLELQKNNIHFWSDNLSPVGFIKTLNTYKDEISNILH